MNQYPVEVKLDYETLLCDSFDELQPEFIIIISMSQDISRAKTQTT